MEGMRSFFCNSNILIIDDCYKNIETLTEVLNKSGYGKVKSVTSSEGILEVIGKNTPDIILLNVNLKNEDGYEMCKILKGRENIRGIPIIFISGESNDINVEKVFDVGGIDYLKYPFNNKEVLICIEMQLKIRFMQNELVELKEKHRQSYGELEKINEDLIKNNKNLESEVFEKDRQLKEITDELKEFNIILEEEINERTKTEEALKESERQFRHSMEEAPVPIMLYADDGIVKKINRSWTDITGYTIEDIPTISECAKISDVFIEDLKNISISRLFNSEKRQNNGEFFVKTRTGNIKICNFYSAYIGELQGGYKLFMKVAIDVTEKKLMEELQKSVEEERKKLYEVKEYDRIKTEFFSNISHELRTPINVIFSALQMHEINLKDCSFRDGRVDKYKYTKIMKQNCYRILRLVNNIIDITKIDSGYFDINEQNINIISLIENITLSVADYIENKGLTLIFDTDVEEKVLACDPEKIERIILNLLSNAVKFTSFGGKIMVNIEDGAENICVRIKDTGRGIPKDKLNSIFERFIQVDKSLTRDQEGSGIGLSLVKCLIELHGGTISVESQVDHGTEFIIYFPCKLVENIKEEYSFCDSIGENCIEKINIEFSDIYN